VMDHRDLERMAAATEKPVLNMLSDRSHPLQALADLLTAKQLLASLREARIAYVGDANNVCHSLAEACSLLGVPLSIASPQGYGFTDAIEGVRQVSDPAEAVEGANIVYTDVWVSMGQDDETERRRQAFAAYQVTPELMARSDDAWFLHCLPARRGEEVTHDVMECAKSGVWKQAENRMHTARGALAWMLGIR
jgi:ornithine carbamoyltransferase